LKSAEVTILEPASERGNAGVDELQEQTVNLLNFQQLTNKVFGGQLAFNILSEREASERTENRVMEQIGVIVGDTFPKPLITAAQMPVFHSHVYSMFVHLVATPGVSELATHLDCGTELPSPVGVVGTDKIHAGRITIDPNHAGAYSVWLFADNLRIAASNAIQTAEHIVCAPALET
jgi:aspartate-semialdehyde dehydrogenase